jgi:copper chaperone CopZ
MKSFFVIISIALFGLQSNAQFTNAALQASGLTCSMCSKAVKTALEKVPFVEKVQVNLKTQEYNLTFKANDAVDFDALAKAVEDAGFSVSALKVTADVNGLDVKKDTHLKIGNQYFHFLNAANQSLNGSTSFTLVDKSFVPAKAYKKWSTATKMECVQTGKAAACCTSDGVAGNARVYHAVI